MFKLVIKGVLLYTTILLILFFLMGIDSIFEAHIMLEWLLTICVLVILCYKYLTKEDVMRLSLANKAN